MPVRALLAFTTLTVMLLAGCAGNEPGAGPADAAVPGAVVGSVDLATLDANSSLAAPSPWALGDWFGVHVFVGMEDTEGTHYNTVVVEETSTEWVLATDDA